MINFSLSGEAEWRGGIAQGADNFILKKSLPVENGVNRVLIRSTPKAGKIVVNATAENLKSAKIELQTKPFHSVNGLSIEMPYDNLLANLSRGTTPLG